MSTMSRDPVGSAQDGRRLSKITCESTAFHKGAFQALLHLMNKVESIQRNPLKQVLPKKTCNLLASYLEQCCHHVDEFLDYGGINVVIDKNNKCSYISEEDAKAWVARNYQSNQKKSME